MIDANKKYRTRSGIECRIYATDGAGRFPVHGAIQAFEGWILYRWSDCGLASPGAGCEQDYDLVEVAENEAPATDTATANC